MAGTTPTLSPPSPLWSGTDTALSRPYPPAQCRCPPSFNQVWETSNRWSYFSNRLLGGETGFGLNHITVLFFWLALFSGGSATSSPAMLGIRRHSSNYQRAQSSMQLDTYYGDNSLHKRQYTGLWHSSGICTRAAGVSLKQPPFQFGVIFILLSTYGFFTSGSEKKTPYFIGTYSSQSGEDLRRSQVRSLLLLHHTVMSCSIIQVRMFSQFGWFYIDWLITLFSKHPEPFYDEPDRKNFNSYRMYLSSPQGYGEEHFEDEPAHLTPSSPDGYATQSLRFKANTNYVDFYSTTRRPSNRANKFTGSPDSWV